jgi:hypothetical protein
MSLGSIVRWILRKIGLSPSTGPVTTPGPGSCNAGHGPCRTPTENSFCSLPNGHTGSHSCGQCGATW